MLFLLFQIFDLFNLKARIFFNIQNIIKNDLKYCHFSDHRNRSTTIVRSLWIGSISMDRIRSQFWRVRIYHATSLILAGF
jgi:hypothetical protein